ncbi:MAG TPA: dipeptidase PepE [Patescibacteria group bacterium]|nr:dipeptidase PepE [Patescibacteria group bacterium]
MRLVLLSNSTNFGGGYLDHAAPAVEALFAGVKRIGFVPFAIADQAGYHQRVVNRFRSFGIDVVRISEGPEGMRALDGLDGIFVGGGNTWRLLDKLQKGSLVAPIRARVRAGMPYLGSSAGTGVAAPTLMTTNDMPIVHPESFESLGLVPFQLNCHYMDPDPVSKHMGETRETRIREFHEENATPVVGLREGSWLEVDDGGAAATGASRMRVHLRGPHRARIFRRGSEPVEAAPDTTLDPLVL